MSPDTNDRPAEPGFSADERLSLDSERAVWREVGDEIVILDVPTATYLTLNSSAVTLWKHLEEGATPSELSAELVATYEIGEDKAAQDVQRFLGALKERSLILPAP
ncbi:MAG TPA: PqqD family protein [Acidimicrobiales bacterium]|nr:PqqD family protein [Acidimicrobiales bacterium]